MTILYVDTEHESVRTDPRRAPAHDAGIAADRALLAATAGAPCLIAPYAAVSPAFVADLAPAAIIISGNTTRWDEYGRGAWTGLFATIRAAPVPILGICAGHQLIGRAHGAAWGPLGRLAPGERDPDPAFGPGQRKEQGFLPVMVDDRCPLFAGLRPAATFFQHHYWQLTAAPAGFVVRARSPWTAVQAIARDERPVFGVQFHPERADLDHPDGVTVLRNFFALSVGPRADPPAPRGG